MGHNLSNRAYGFMLLCSFSLLIIFTTSCQNAKLKTVVALAQKQCPISIGESGEVSNITYDGQNVVYTFSINENFSNIEALKANQESLKTSMKVMFQNPAKDVKEMLELIIKCKATLQLEYIGKDTGNKVTCELTADELKDMLDTSSVGSDLTKLETQLKMANLQFPMQASEEVTIEKVELNNESVVYLCQVDEDLCDMNSIVENTDNVKLAMMESLGNKADLATQQFLKSCLDCNKNIVYRYIGNQTGTQHDVVITVPELKEATK